MEWKNAKENKPEEINEHWAFEKTAQPVLVQYLIGSRIELAMACFERGTWFYSAEDGGVIEGEVLFYAEVINEQLCNICFGKKINPNTNKICKACKGKGKRI